MITQEELINKIYRLQCCSSNLALLLIDNINVGSRTCKKEENNLILLNNSIDLLLKYNLTEDSANCLIEEEFNKIYNNSINICKICDCE